MTSEKAERERIKVIPKGRFTVVETMEEIYSLLFGGVLNDDSSI